MEEKIYSPDIAIAPGETLQDILHSLGMSQVELAHRLAMTPKTVNEIIQGKNPITPDTAIKLSAIFGMSASFWSNLEINYQRTLARLKAEEKLEKEVSFLDNFAVYNELAQWGYVHMTRNPKEKVRNLLNFFAVSSLRLVPKVQGVAFRKTKTQKLSKQALAAWLRCGDIGAQKIGTDEFDKHKAINSIEYLRLLTKENPTVFSKKLVEICASFGIAVVYTPYFKNTYVNGATKWLTPYKALIQLNIRGRFEDIFWFTFFHEFAHVLKHKKKKQFIDFNADSGLNRILTESEEEKEADRFATDILIPKKEYMHFIKQKDFSAATIIEFANRINISSGIVAGRLSHEYGDWRKWAYLRKKLDIKRENI